MADTDPIELIRRLSESYKQVRFGPGVVPKTARAMIGLLAVWVVIVWRLSADLLQDGALLLAGLLAAALFVWWVRRTHAFAERNPALALLEGSQLVEYQRFVAQLKGQSPPEGERLVHRATANQTRLPDSDEPDNV